MMYSTSSAGDSESSDFTGRGNRPASSHLTPAQSNNSPRLLNVNTHNHHHNNNNSVSVASLSVSQSSKRQANKDGNISVVTPSPTTAGKKKILPKKKNTPVCCTIPIAVVFALTCTMIAAVFTIITLQSTLSFTKQVEMSLEESISTALQGAMKHITDPLSQSVAFAKQMKLMIESDPQRFACDDGDVTNFPGNVSNTNFLYEVGMHSIQRPVLQYVYQTRFSKRYNDSSTGERLPIICLMSPLEKKATVYRNHTAFAVSFVDGNGLNKLNSLPYAVSSTAHFNLSAIAVVSGALTTAGNRWESATTSAAAATFIAKYTYFLQLEDPSEPGAKWVLGLDHAISSAKVVLLQATPPLSLGDASVTPSQTPGAHTTLYDENAKILMTSTHDNIPLAQASGSLFVAGQAPVTYVNAAYQIALEMCPGTQCTVAKVKIGKDAVISVYRLYTPDTNMNMLVVQSVPRDYYFVEADRTFATTLGLSITSCVLIIAGCIILLLLIQRPLSSLKENMMQAAELHNDRVEHTRTYLRDIAHLSAVFDCMNQQLLIARSFVPEAVLLGKTEDSQAEDFDDEGSLTANDKSTIHTRTKDNGSSKAGSSRYRNANDPLSTVDGTNASSDNSSNGMAKLFNVAEKRVGVLSLNLVGFHSLCAPERHINRAQKIHEISTTLLTMAVGCAHGERGVMDSFHGDHFVLTFNASRAVAGPLTAAVRTANVFINEVRGSDVLRGSGGVGAGAAIGRAHVGTFGIDGYRRMSVVGEAYRTANTLQQAAVQFLRMNGAVREGCMIEEAALKELGNCALHLQVIGSMQSSAHRASSGKLPPTTVYFAHPASQDEATLKAMKANGEWLYELDAIESTNPYHDSNNAMLALMGGDLDQCAALIDAHESNNHNTSSTTHMGGGAGTPSASSNFMDTTGGSTSVLPGGTTTWSLIYRSYSYVRSLRKQAMDASPEERAESASETILLPYQLFSQ